MIAKGDYKLIMYPKAQVTRLFNTTKDPDEMNDLAMNPEYAVTMAKLKANFLELQKSMDDTLDVDKPGAKKKMKKSKKPKK